MDNYYPVGIDVSQDWLDVERVDGEEKLETMRFDNTPAGHRKLCKWLRQHGSTARVVVEATGSYHLKLVRALAASAGIEVMVVNPTAVKHFRKALLQRASTDTISASALRQYAQRMEFVGWTPPTKAMTELRALSRRAETLTEMKTQEKNHLHAARVGGEPAAVIKDIRASIVAISKRIEAIRAEALKTIRGDKTLEQGFASLCSVKGIGTLSAITILAELASLPRNLTVRQWVAYAGLDPKPVESGSSVKQPRRISKLGNVHLRRGLYMPALVAMRHNPPVKAFAEHLSAKGKKKLVVVIAVMRKLLHAIYGMLKRGTTFEPQKFYRTTEKLAA